MKRIFIKGNLIYFENNDTGSYEAYPMENMVIKFNNNRYYFQINGAVVQSHMLANILDQNGAAYESQDIFENMLGRGEDKLEGYGVHRLTSAATTNSTLIKPGKTTFVGGVYSNASASPIYLKLYDKATAPTVGTDIPRMTISIPANNSKVIDLMDGVVFDKGLGLALTGAAGDADTTAIGANELIAQTFVEGLPSFDIEADIFTGSTPSVALGATGELAGAITTETGSLIIPILGIGILASAVNTDSTPTSALISVL